jgi:hypothetical protein
VLLNAPQLRSARAKIQRAEEHLGQLRAEHDRFIQERNPYRMLREMDAEPRYYVWRAKIVEPPPLERWGSLAGECVHALRSALDHTAYALVRINRPSAEYSEFPIFKERGGPKGWAKKGEGKLPGVNRKVLAQVKWLQPYRRDADLDPLWVIHDLDIVDKHRRLNLVSPMLRHSRYTTDDEGDIDDVQPLAGPFIDGTPVARFRLREGTVDVQTEFAFDIAFGEGRLKNHPVMHTLEMLMVYAGGVVARFDRFFK